MALWGELHTGSMVAPGYTNQLVSLGKLKSSPKGVTPSMSPPMNTLCLMREYKKT